MAKMVGLARTIKLEWLNKTVELLKEGKTETEIKDDLNEYLSFEIKSPTNLRKTREILLNIWVRIPDEFQNIKKLALEVYSEDYVNRLSAHWCMLLLAYPVFGDVCALIGKLTNIQDKFTTAWLKERLLELWGERTTLLHASDKILQTLRYVGAVENEKTGVYRIKSYEIKSDAARSLIALTVLALKGNSYCEINELSQSLLMFPFKYSISRELLHNSEIFKLSNFGGKIVVAS